MDEVNVNQNDIRIRLIRNREETIRIFQEIDESNLNLAFISDMYCSQNCKEEERVHLLNKSTELKSIIRNLKMRLLEVSKIEVSDYALLQNIVNKKKNLATNLSAIPQFGNATINIAVDLESQSIMEYQILMDEIQSFLTELDGYLSETDPTDSVKSYGQKTL